MSDITGNEEMPSQEGQRPAESDQVVIHAGEDIDSSDDMDDMMRSGTTVLLGKYTVSDPQVFSALNTYGCVMPALARRLR